MNATILSVAYPFARVGPGAVGGAEQILTSLEGELVARGLGSVVLAREGSTAAGRLIETHVPEGVFTPEVREAVRLGHCAGLEGALRSGPVDLVHMHGIDFFEYPVPSGIPVLVTLHLPPSWYPESIWHLPSHYRLQCVSEAQRLACPEEVRDRLPVVGNGVIVPGRSRGLSKRNFALMLSRICPEKNLHEGMEAARLAGTPLVLGGEAFPYEEHLRYLHEQIQPRLGPGVIWPGAVGGRRKERLLESARCLLLPTLAPETSSLVAMEAIAAGTPVIAYPSGAIPEIVEDGRTGFLVRDVAEMAAAIKKVHMLDSEECRSTARARFPLGAMVDGYLALYAEMLGGGSRDTPPREGA